jgi:4a-hydroxytetrahydrobiopterin dehydratase
MADLSSMRCDACRAGAPAVPPNQYPELLAQIPDWSVIECDGVPRLERVFNFKGFAPALSFTNRVGALAEKENHHPTIITEWGRVTVIWWTHKIGNLHQNDFIMAKRTDALA